MMFAHYRSLKPGAKKALKRGTGKYRKYAVDGNYISVLDENGRAITWTLVIKGDGPTIVATRVKK